MVNKEFFQALRFEERYGIGSIIDTIHGLNSGKTLVEIAAELSKRHPISPPQLMRYIRCFTTNKYFPSKSAITFYHSYRYNNEETETQISLMAHELATEEERLNVIYVNFRPSQKTSQRN